MAAKHFETLVVGAGANTLDDGEAATIAYALTNRLEALIDERKACRICAERFAALDVTTTVEVLLDPAMENELGRKVVSRWLSEGALVFVEKYKPWSGGGGTLYAVGDSEQFDRLVDECEPRHVVFLGRWRPQSGILDEAIFLQAAEDQVQSECEPFVGLPTYFPEELDATFPVDEIDIKECIEEYGGQFGWFGNTPNFPSSYWEREVDRPLGILVTRT